MDKHLYDSDGNYLGRISDVAPGGGAWYLHVGPAEFEERYSTELKRAKMHVSSLEQKLASAHQENNRVEIERLSEDLKWAKRRLRFVEEMPFARSRYRAGDVAGKGCAIGCAVVIVAFLVICIVGIYSWIYS